MRGALTIAMLCACGRVGFDASVITADAPGDAGFCATMTAATFCRDFDEGQAFADWTDVATNFGTVMLDTSEAHSQPASERVDTLTLASGESESTYLEQTNLGVATTATVELELFVDTPGSQDAVFFQVRTDDGIRTHAFELVTRAPPGVAYVEDADGPTGMSATNYQSYPLVVLATGQWHHIQLTYTAGASAQLDVFFDGVNVLSRVPVYTTGGQAAALLGLSYINGPSTPWQVHFDDLAVTIR